MDMPESEAAPSIDDMKDAARAVYTNAFNDIMERVLEEFILPADRVSILYDAAQFFTFMCAAKIVGAQYQAPTRANLMAAYWPMQKALKDEVPGMLRSLADAMGVDSATPESSI